MLHVVGIKIKPCIEQLLTKGHKTTEGDKLSPAKVVMFAYTRGSHLQEVPKYKVFIGGSWFGVLDSIWLFMDVF